jgi:hypothetical protein
MLVGTTGLRDGAAAEVEHFALLRPIAERWDELEKKIRNREAFRIDADVAHRAIRDHSAEVNGSS